MISKYPYHNSPRCDAKTKRNNGAPCRSPAVRGKKRCRIHGGGKGSGGQPSNKNALKHGNFTAQTKKFRRAVKTAINEAGVLLKNLS